MIEPYKSFEEFETSYKEEISNRGLFYICYNPIWKKDTNKKWFHKLFKKDTDEIITGYFLCPIVEVECLCMRIHEVDIKYINAEGCECWRRVKPTEIYHYDFYKKVE